MRVRGFVQAHGGAIDSGFIRNGRSYLFEPFRGPDTVAVYTAFRSTHHTISGDPVGRTTLRSSELVAYLAERMGIDAGLLGDRIETALEHPYHGVGEPDAPVAIAARLNRGLAVSPSLVSLLPAGYAYLDFDDGRPAARSKDPLVVPSPAGSEGPAYVTFDDGSGPQGGIVVPEQPGLVDIVRSA